MMLNIIEIMNDECKYQKHTKLILYLIILYFNYFKKLNVRRINLVLRKSFVDNP